MEDEMTTTNATANRFPESVYRHTSDEPVEYVGGYTMPPFTRDQAEKIAATKPDWAEYDHTDITGGPLTRNHEITEVTWCRKFGKVDILQDATYIFATGEKVGEGKPYIHSWTDEFTDADSTTMHAAHLAEAARLLDAILATEGDAQPAPIDLLSAAVLGARFVEVARDAGWSVQEGAMVYALRDAVAID